MQSGLKKATENYVQASMRPKGNSVRDRLGVLSSFISFLKMALNTVIEPPIHEAMSSFFLSSLNCCHVWDDDA